MPISFRLLLFLLCMVPGVRGGFPETVLVQSPNNAADVTGFGAVPYAYRIGKYEVTNAEYTEFLSAVARSDTHQLYDERMAGEYGGILRRGTPGNFVYEVKPGMGKKPVNYVSWESCLRYANWLTNGRGKGSTEKGAYTIEANKTKGPDHAALAAGRSAHWALPTENEWYKAAYFDPRKSGGPGYWPYAVMGGQAPKCNINSNAIADVGSFAAAASPWGTFDQNGNMWEYNEAQTGGKVGVRGGSFYLNDNDSYLQSQTRYDVLSAKWPNYGFRVVLLGGAGAKAPLPQPTAPNPPPVTKRTGGPRVFYVSSSTGSDENTGEALGSGKSGPWKTLARASIEYLPGDQILMKCGDTWNEEFRPKGSGTARQPITIGSYGKGAKPLIDLLDDKKDLAGIRLSDQEGYKIAGIEFARCLTGIYADYAADSPQRKFIWIEDCYFHDSLLYQQYQDYPNRKIGLGVCFFSYEKKNKIVLSDVTVRNCVFRRLASGIWTNSPDNFNKAAGSIYNFANFTIEGCLFEDGHQWQLGMRGVDGGSVRNCVTHNLGANFRAFNGVAGAMFARCKNWVFENSEWGYISIGRPGAVSGDGQAFDFESNCDHMVMRNCIFHNTDGPGFLLCCYASGPEPEKDIVLENCVFNGQAKRVAENRMPKVEIINTTDLNEVTWRRCRFYLAPGVGLYATMDITWPDKPLDNLKFIDCVIKQMSEVCQGPALPATIIPLIKSSGKLASTAAWEASDEEGYWMTLEFPEPTLVSEFKLQEKPESKISRYVIECWDEQRNDWVGVFNGAAVGPQFLAPIASRTTTKARVSILQTIAGEPQLQSVAAYHDTTGQIYSDTTGSKPPKHVGK